MRFHWLPSTYCPVIGQGKNCKFQYWQVWSRWSMDIWLPWSVIRFQWSPSTYWPVIGQGENCQFQNYGYEQGDHWLSDCPDQWSDFGDHPVQIIQWSGEGEIASFDNIKCMIWQSLTICLPWSVIRFQCSPSTKCPVIRQGENCKFQ